MQRFQNRTMLRQNMSGQAQAPRQAPANMHQSPESCSDYCEKDFTFVMLIHNPHGYNPRVGRKDSKRMTLQQHPNESLILDYTVSYSFNDSYNFNLTLKFENKLHEISQDYGYEVMLRALVEENGSSYHLPLLSMKELRTKESIDFKNIEFNGSNKFNRLFEPTYVDHYGSSVNSAFKLLHVCCGIRRFHKSRVGVKNSEFPLDELFRQQLHSDVRLKVGDREFKAHRAILALRSPIFRAMFSNTETLESRTGVVTIDDIEAPVFEAMLRYVYTNCAKEGISKFPGKLFKAAHKYDIAGLVAECEEALMFELKFDNVVEFLDLASFYDLRTLKRGAVAFIKKYEEQMVRVPSYQDFLCRDLCNIGTLVCALKFCAKYDLPKVKAAAFDLIKKNLKQVASYDEYLGLFKTHPELMQEIFVYVNN